MEVENDREELLETDQTEVRQATRIPPRVCTEGR
jgi:hypothetical protein